MRNRFAERFAAILMLAAALVTTACAAAGQPAGVRAAAIDTRIKPLIETLKLDTVALEEQYGLLRASAAGYAFRGVNEQLNHIQKAALFVQSALEGAKHEWEILSIVDYIRSESLEDYFTLRAHGLKRAAEELAFNITLIDLYGAMLEADVPRDDVSRALTLLKALQRDYRHLIAAVQPLAKAPDRTTARLNDRSIPGGSPVD